MRDARPMVGKEPQAVWFKYAADRKGERPPEHLKPPRCPQTNEALCRIAELYEVEARVRGRRRDKRRRVRQQHTVPKLVELHHWMEATLAATSPRSVLAQAIRYSLVRWQALTRFANENRRVTAVERGC